MNTPIRPVQSSMGEPELALPFDMHVTEWAFEDELPLVWTPPVNVASENLTGGVPVSLPRFAVGNHPEAQFNVLGSAHPTVNLTGWTQTLAGASKMMRGKPLTEVEQLFADSDANSQRPQQKPSVATLSRRANHKTLGYELDWEPTEGGPIPYRLHVHVRIHLTEDLVITVKVTNTDTHDYFLQESLPVYFAVGDVKDLVVTGLEAAEYFDVAREPLRWRHQLTEVSIIGPTDRIYRSSSGSLTILDPRARRSASIDSENSDSTLIWNPWPSQTGIGHTPMNWLDFTCIEVGNVGEAAIHLDPGESHSMMAIVQPATIA